ncbi:MAG: hypothetical protein HQL18_00575 [Candidatus Omnitrophica bacterium]|nr:hypothetical protein [Candidatus Omnitrophota bacterium]
MNADNYLLYYDKMVAFVPSYESYALRGFVKEVLGDAPSASKDYEQALLFNKECFACGYNLGRQAFLRGQYQEAQRFLMMALGVSLEQSLEDSFESMAYREILLASSHDIVALQKSMILIRRQQRLQAWRMLAVSTCLGGNLQELEAAGRLWEQSDGTGREPLFWSGIVSFERADYQRTVELLMLFTKDSGEDVLKAMALVYLQACHDRLAGREGQDPKVALKAVLSILIKQYGQVAPAVF